MSILAPLAFLILLLTLGFRYNAWGLSFLIFMLTSSFFVLLGISNLEEVRRQWSSRRCDLDILVTAHLYKPTDDPRSGGEFAAENFNFCMRSLMVTMITVMLKPVYMLLNQQLDVTDTVADQLNRFRSLQTTLMAGFMNVINPIFQRFKTTGAALVVNQHKLLMAMGRAFGITQATLYIGMSLVLAIENFVHFVINVIMIVMYIILGLMILIFPLIIPVFGLIVYTCQIIGNSKFGYLTEDVCGELCFDPTTRIRLQSGKVQTLAECVVGDVFEDGTRIEGILTATGEKEPMLVLDGIRVTGAHLVWYEKTQDWIAVANHPDAQISFHRSPRLICLRTSTRRIPLHGLTTTWSFRDWEELPSNLPASDTIWDFLISEILNQKPSNSKLPSEHPLLRDTCQVMYKTGEIRSISEVKIGDEIYSSQGFTKVTGLYTGEAEFSKDTDLTDGLWFKGLGDTEWHHPPVQEGVRTLVRGFHCTTESGCFWIQTDQVSGFVRDFTEVGADNLFVTYTYTRALLKKSLCREESCVSGSLSQDLSSSLPLTF